YPADVGLVGYSGPVLRALLPLIQRKNDRKFLETAQERVKGWNELLKERGTRTDFPMKPQVVGYTVNKFLPDDALVISDTGTVTTWAARYLRMREGMMFSAS